MRGSQVFPRPTAKRRDERLDTDLPPRPNMIPKLMHDAPPKDQVVGGRGEVQEG
jgi:hypothetical protein